MTITINDTPRVWIGCLACYNSGSLVGKWVDANEAAAFVPCKRSEFGFPHEEFWVMDHENFNGFLNGECSPSEAQELYELMQEIEKEHDLDAVAAWLSKNSETLKDFDEDEFTSCYFGQYDSERDFAEHWAESTVENYEEKYANSVWPFNFIDWDRATRDLMFSFTSVEDGNHGYFIFLDR